MSLIGFKARNHEQQTARRGALDEVDDRGTKWDFIRTVRTGKTKGHAYCAECNRLNARRNYAQKRAS